MKKAMKFSIIFFVVILFTASIFAQPQRRMMRGKGLINRSPSRILRIIETKQKELNITDNQLEKIRDLSFSLEEKMIQMRSNISLQRLEVRKLLQDKKNLDYERIRAVLSKASKFRQDIFIERLKTKKEIGNILTPEQREAIKAMRKERLRGIREGRLFQRRDRLQRFPPLKSRIKK